MIIKLENHFRDMKSFTSIYENIRVFTAIDYQGLQTLYHDAIYANYLEGDFAECGCWKGGSSYLLASTLRPNKRLFVLDSFKGLSEPTDEDFENVPDKMKGNMSKGLFTVKKSDVEKFLESFADKVKIIEGYFSDTLYNEVDVELSTSKFSLVHIDVDLCDPYRQCIEFFYPRMIDGGIMIFDEYEFHGCPNSTKVIDKFLSGIKYDGYRHGNRLSIQVRKDGAE